MLPTPAIMNLPKTISSSEFEAMSKDVLEARLNLDFYQYGRKGQSQDGIDYFSEIKKGRLVVAQCKNYYNPESSKRLTNKIMEDIESASVKNEIVRFIALTSADTDKTIIDTIFDYSKKYPFNVDIWFWYYIQETIIMKRDLLRKYYPDWQTDSSLLPHEFNTLMSIFDTLDKASYLLYSKCKYYRITVNERSDMEVYNVCVSIKNASIELADMKSKYYLQIYELGLIKIIDEVLNSIPEFADETVDGTGTAMIWTISNYTTYFTSIHSPTFNRKCKQALRKLQWSLR